eukprot:3910585-Amphidinium_carterae.2
MALAGHTRHSFGGKHHARHPCRLCSQHELAKLNLRFCTLGNSKRENIALFLQQYLRSPNCENPLTSSSLFLQRKCTATWLHGRSDKAVQLKGRITSFYERLYCNHQHQPKLFFSCYLGC